MPPEPGDGLLSDNRPTQPVNSSTAAPAEPIPARQPEGPQGIRLLVILGALTALGPLSIDMYLPALPSLPHQLSATTSAAQLTLTACLIGLGLGQLVAGPISDAHGRRRPILAGVALYVAASVLCVLVPSVGALIVLRFVQGLAGGVGIVNARAVVGDLYHGAAAAHFFALMMAVAGVAPILAPHAGGQLLHLTAWRGIFAAIAGVGLIAFHCGTTRRARDAARRGAPEGRDPCRRPNLAAAVL